MACQDIAEKRSRIRKRLSRGASPCPSDPELQLKQPKIDDAIGLPGLPITQQRLDSDVMV